MKLSKCGKIISQLTFINFLSVLLESQSKSVRIRGFIEFSKFKRTGKLNRYFLR